MKERFISPFFWIGIVGGLKLILDAFGISLISDDQVNTIANGLAALATVLGVAVSYGTKCLDNTQGTK